MEAVSLFLMKERYAVPVKSVVEFFQLAEYESLPDMPKYLLGVGNVRGHIMPVVCLRSLFGASSATTESKELIELLNAREQDHIKWLTTLEDSVVKGEPFQLALDPTQCGFGKWYYSFKSWHRELTKVLRKFEAPHNRIHGLGQLVRDLVSENKKEEALKLIELHRNTTMKELIETFAHAKKILATVNWQTGVIVESGSSKLILAVDSVGETYKLDAMPSPLDNRFVKQVLNTESGLVKVLDTESIFEVLKKSNKEIDDSLSKAA